MSKEQKQTQIDPKDPTPPEPPLPEGGQVQLEEAPEKVEIRPDVASGRN